jgi:dienelactone hydrolase
MGPLPTSERRVDLAVEIESVESTEKYTRIKLTYVPEAGDRVPAYLLVPHHLTAPAPAMLCLHPTHFELGKAQLLGLGGKVSRFYAHELAERGMVCLVPDYPGFAEYKFDFATQGSGYASGTMKAIWNNIRGLDLLESLPCVQRDAIGCIGHSLGGHNSLYTAAFDVRIGAVVTSCGFNAFEDYYGGNLKGWTSDRYMPRIASEYGSDPARMPFDFPEVLAAIAPRPLFVNAPLRDANFAVVGVRKCQAAVEPVYQLLGKRDAVTFVYPDAEHDFPDEVREQAYQWLEKQLAHR